MPERFDLASEVPADERLDALRAIAPDAFHEGKIDFEALRRSLGDWVDPGPERFGLTWPGKAECMRVIQEPSIGTLAPMADESKDWDTTQNLIIEGDNLEVLKLMQKAYYGKVKLIYIDPPYNTGKEFIYPDNFREGLADYLRYSGQVDEEGFKVSANADTDGRYHSKWLSMMYPRLFLARNLLREDGAILITIDDTEVANLRKVMDEIWGEENFVCTIAWQKVFAKKNKAVVSGSHDHILVYARDLARWDRRLLPRDEEQEAAFKNPDGDARGPWQSVSFSVQSEGADRREGYRYEAVLPSGRQVKPPTGRHWNGDPARFEELRADGRIWFGRDGDSPPRVKTFRSEVQEGIVPDTWWRHEETGNNQEAKKELLELFGDQEPFTTPKPTRLIRRMLQIATGSGDIVLDFFAGSGTTGHAVFAENIASGIKRSFILVQLPEPTPGTGFRSLAEITRERVRRAGLALARELPLGGSEAEDLGFRAYRLSSSNFTVWDPSATADQLEQQLQITVEHVVEGATDASMVSELLLKAGYPLGSPVESLDLAGIPGYSVADGALLVCLAKQLTIAAFEAMVEHEPAMILVLDAGFDGSDELKVNALQTVRARNQSSGSDITLRVV
jgi:adenine-specific DNA-methyltransferase